MSANYQMGYTGALKASFQSSLDGTLSYKRDTGNPNEPQTVAYRFVGDGYRAFKPIRHGLLLAITGIALVIIGAVTAPTGVGVALLVGGVVFLGLSSHKFRTANEKLEELRKNYLGDVEELKRDVAWLESQKCFSEKSVQEAE